MRALGGGVAHVLCSFLLGGRHASASASRAPPPPPRPLKSRRRKPHAPNHTLYASPIAQSIVIPLNCSHQTYLVTQPASIPTTAHMIEAAGRRGLAVSFFGLFGSTRARPLFPPRAHTATPNNPTSTLARAVLYETQTQLPLRLTTLTPSRARAIDWILLMCPSFPPNRSLVSRRQRAPCSRPASAAAALAQQQQPRAGTAATPSTPTRALTTRRPARWVFCGRASAS
jgi:hypothetical protein